MQLEFIVMKNFVIDILQFENSNQAFYLGLNSTSIQSFKVRWLLSIFENLWPMASTRNSATKACLLEIVTHFFPFKTSQFLWPESEHKHICRRDLFCYSYCHRGSGSVCALDWKHAGTRQDLNSLSICHIFSSF